MYNLTAEDTRKLLLKLRMSMGDVVHYGEFARWLFDKEMPWSAMKELEELEDLYDLLRKLEEHQDRKILDGKI